MFGKACNILLSAGLAPNNDATWQLLLSKQPSCPPPFVPQVSSTPISVEPDFNILGALRSFPKGTAAGPLGLRVQHLLDAASIIPLPTSTCSSLRDIASLLASCKVPLLVSKYLAYGNLTALNNLKEGNGYDIRPIAVGELIMMIIALHCFLMLGF